MHSPPIGMCVSTCPSLANLGLPLFKSCIFVLEGNIQSVSGIFFMVWVWFISKASVSSEAVFSWISLFFGNEDEQLACSDVVVNFDDVKPD